MTRKSVLGDEISNKIATYCTAGVMKPICKYNKIMNNKTFYNSKIYPFKTNDRRKSDRANQHFAELKKLLCLFGRLKQPVKYLNKRLREKPEVVLFPQDFFSVKCLISLK